MGEGLSIYCKDERFLVVSVLGVKWKWTGWKGSLDLAFWVKKDRAWGCCFACFELEF